MPAPHSPEAHHRFLDMINYLRSSVLAARRLLPCVNCYRETCTGAGKHLIQKRSAPEFGHVNPPVLKFYFPAKPVTDFETCLSAACLQDGCLVAYT